MSTKRLMTLLIVCALILPTAWAQEKVDLSTIHRIKDEAFQHSKVMDHMFYLTDVYGPRLTNSPSYRAAADWAAKQLTEYGLSNVHFENWKFGKSWAYTHYEGHLLEPQYQPLIGFPMAWTPGTDGTVTGEPVIAVLQTEQDLEKYKGKLKGKIVMTMAPRDLEMHMTAQGHRFTDQELADQALAPDPSREGLFRVPGGPPRRPGQPGRPNMQQMRQFRTKLTQFLHDEQPLVVLQYGYNGDGGTVFGAAGGSRDPKDPVPPPMVVITPEHYNRIARLIEHKIPVKLAFNIQAKIIDQPDECPNIVAEIPGNSKKDEIVMVGAHFDSWHGGTGATDNAAGSAVMMEVVRVLKALNLPLDRTVRIGLWGGEEEGLLGSREYVKAHFGDPQTMKLLPEHEKLDAYYNIDNGSGKIRGIYLQGNDMVRPIFRAWLAPFRDLGATTLTIRNTSGTDHLSFDAVGLPGFQFIQDPLEYMARTHHSNMDVYDRIQAGDLMQISAIVASFVYDTSQRPEMLPRKPLPPPQPRREGGAPAPTGGN